MHTAQTTCAFCISAQRCPTSSQIFVPTCRQHRCNLGSTLANKAPTSAQPGTTWLQPQPNLGPRCRNLASSWAHLGTTSAQVELHVSSTPETWPAQYETVETRVFNLSPFFVLMTHVFVMMTHLSPELSPGPKLRHVEHDLDVHMHHMASIWGASGSIWTHLQPNMTNCLHLALKLDPTLGKLGPS